VKARLCLVLGIVLSALAVPAAASAAPGVNPNLMRGLGRSGQVIEIATRGMRTSFATARTYRLTELGWRPVHAAMPARVGWAGLVRPTERVAGDGTTPLGVYGIAYGFGSRPDPGLHRFDWRRLRPGDCWSGTPADYNRWVERTPCAPEDEDLWLNARRAYRYAAVIDFNYRHPVFGRGSGIFLHVSTHSATEGCVSLPERDLLAVLRWMKPGVKVLIGPERWLRSLKHEA
jgi:L,D-peptidoglycan transpeptidase YkuD (ErfK/YbiS/YcfS/YnhG family)